VPLSDEELGALSFAEEDALADNAPLLSVWYLRLPCRDEHNRLTVDPVEDGGGVHYGRPYAYHQQVGIVCRFAWGRRGAPAALYREIRSRDRIDPL